jgi:hypothetical protein
MKTIYALDRTPYEKHSIKMHFLMRVFWIAELFVVDVYLVDGHSNDTFVEMQED